MPLSLLAQSPCTEDFVPLAQHQASTPQSFFDDAAVLHLHVTNCLLLGYCEQIEHSDALRQWWQQAAARVAVDGGQKHSEAEEEAPPMTSSTRNILNDVEIFISSKAVTLKASNGVALALTYPSINIHAVQRVEKSSFLPVRIDDGDVSTQWSTVYLELDPWHDERMQVNPEGDDLTSDKGSIDLLLLPKRAETDERSNSNGSSTSPPNHLIATAIFGALSACADLWPDVNDLGGGSDDEGAGFSITNRDELIPGNGGWITAENAHEYESLFSDAGDSSPMAPDLHVLGPGAGSRRPRDEVDGTGDGNKDAEDSKWQRT